MIITPTIYIKNYVNNYKYLTNPYFNIACPCKVHNYYLLCFFYEYNVNYGCEIIQ